jgi:hypothetical protein
VLKLLSAYGAHFDIYDNKGNNPIHMAAEVNAGSCCRFLATRGKLELIYFNSYHHLEVTKMLKNN